MAVQPNECGQVKVKKYTVTAHILLVRYGLKLAGDACYQHKLPSEVLQQFGTTAAYSFKAMPSFSDDTSSLDSED